MKTALHQSQLAINLPSTLTGLRSLANLVNYRLENKENDESNFYIFTNFRVTDVPLMCETHC